MTSGTDIVDKALPTPGCVGYGARLRDLAERHPDKLAVIVVEIDGTETTLTYGELEAKSNQAAWFLAKHGVDPASLVAIGEPNCVEHYVWTIGAWKLGACCLSLNPRLPNHERDQILELASPTVVISEWEGVGGLSNADLADVWLESTDPQPVDLVPRPGRAVASGGSTGRSKIIVLPGGLEYLADQPQEFYSGVGFAWGQVQWIPGPLYHNMPHGWGFSGLAQDHTLVVQAKFDAAQAVDLIERYGVNFGAIVPTHMSRIARLPDIDSRDLSSIQSVMHSAAPCPPWVKRRWFELIGPEKVVEAFGATEAVGATMIRGDEWLEHPGSVGRPFECDLKILDEEGNELPPGEVGEVFTRPNGHEATYSYLGSAPAKSTPDGYVSVGDLGWVDADGYVFVADRRVDLIITGGSNVYPAEVEFALMEHVAVGDVAVIGLADSEWGRRVHAVVERRADVTEEELRAWAKERVSHYKVPKTFEFVDKLPRNDAGKIRRSDMVKERDALSGASA